MPSIAASSSPIKLSSPLPASDLLFESMSHTAGLSALGETQLMLLSAKSDLLPEDVLGKPVTVTVTMRDDGKRHFNGLITRFGAGGHHGRLFSYQATVRPWLWFLTRTSDCRIFQEKSVPEIVTEVFHDHSVADFEFKTFRTYRKWNYCVQYRESDFNFIARLLEHEGIYWYFEHTDGKHKLVLLDSQSAHDAVPGCDSLPYIERAESAPDTDYVTNWSFSRAVKPGRVVLTSYDFERPATDLQVKAAKVRSYDLSDYEVFDFQGDYVQAADAAQWAEDRVDELHTSHAYLRGTSNAEGLAVGRLLSLERHPRGDQNSEYLITHTTIAARGNSYESDGASGSYRCDFSAIPSSQQFRPQRATPKPVVQGSQTAAVVGPAGEEIFTDSHGRVKVQFHWDRYGKRDEKSSCWVRVSQPWAGKGWGTVSIPRIGQEVLVDFLEGDPDQPIIIGRVYNGEQTAPYPLPGGAVVSGMKSNTHKGKGSNEMSMDDTAGKEKVYIHAQYDMTTKVEHDDAQTVVNNRTIGVDGTHTETIKGNTTIKVSEGKLDHDVATGTADYHVTGAVTEKYDATQTTTVKAAIAISSTGGPISVSSDSQHVYINAATSIQLHVGASMIWMDAGGQIKLQGVNVAIEGSAAVTIKGGIVHSEADSEHQTKGAVVLSDGSATNTVKGGMVMLNP